MNEVHKMNTIPAAGFDAVDDLLSHATDALCNFMATPDGDAKKLDHIAAVRDCFRRAIDVPGFRDDLWDYVYDVRIGQLQDEISAALRTILDE
jgi:hypothetical protein